MKNNHGFTLTELLISIVAASIVVAGAYATYDYQQESYINQEQVANMQQNVRAGLYFMLREIRMAGYDPTFNADAAFLTTTRGELKFEVDGDGDGDTDDDEREIIRYALTSDYDFDGLANWVAYGTSPIYEPCHLGREYIEMQSGSEISNGLEALAENIDAIEFCYMLDNGTATTTVTDSDTRDRIRAIIVSALFRTAKPMLESADETTTFSPASTDATLTPDFAGVRPSVWGPFDDRFQRRLAVAKVRCRNMGLNPYED